MDLLTLFDFRVHKNWGLDLDYRAKQYDVLSSQIGNAIGKFTLHVENR